MRKNLVVLAVTALLVASLAGCGSSNAQTKTSVNNSAKTETKENNAEVAKVEYEATDTIAFTVAATDLYKSIVKAPASGEVLTYVEAGTQLRKVGTTEGWGVIDYNGTMAFVAESQLTSVKPEEKTAEAQNNVSKVEAPTTQEVMAAPAPEPTPEPTPAPAPEPAPAPAPAPTPAPAPEPAPVSAGNSSYMAQAEQLVNSQYSLIIQHISGVNQIRASVGLAPLAYDRTLSLIAAYRGIEMAAANKLSHYGTDGSVRCQIVSGFYGLSYSALAENIASGASSTIFSNAYSRTSEQDNINYFISTQSVQNFKNSPSHYQNMVSGSFTRIGVACGFANDTYGHMYLAQIYAN